MTIDGTLLRIAGVPRINAELAARAICLCVRRGPALNGGTVSEGPCSIIRPRLFRATKVNNSLLVAEILASGLARVTTRAECLDARHSAQASSQFIIQGRNLSIERSAIRIRSASTASLSASSAVAGHLSMSTRHGLNCQ